MDFHVSMIDTLKTVGAVVGPFLGGGGVWAYMANRARANAPKTSSPASIINSQADLVEALNNQTKMLLGESTKDRRDLKRVVTRQGLQIARITAEVAECNLRHAECEVKTATLQEQLDAYMSGSVEAYINGGTNNGPD